MIIYDVLRTNVSYVLNLNLEKTCVKKKKKYFFYSYTLALHNEVTGALDTSS